MKTKKMFFIFVVAVLAILLFLHLFGSGKVSDSRSTQTDQELFEETLETCREYAFLHWRTEKLLTEASDYPDHDSWKREMEKLKTDWIDFKSKAGQLESRSLHYLGEPVSGNIIPTAHAVTYGEITDIYDKAPAGRKIKTLTEHLGVDAQTAYDLLDQAQNYARAEAWNEAGDTFQKLETNAVVIKNGCKVSGFVGGVVLSGGTAGLAGASAATKAAVVVSGTDLALEVTEDGANIALGNHNKVSEFVGDARKFTEPAATIITITSIPKNLGSNYDKFSAVMVAADQFRSSAQEGKIIGISLPVAGDNEEEEQIESAVMDREELDEWFSDLGHKREEYNLEELMQEVAKDLEKEEEFQEAVNKKTEAELENEEISEDTAKVKDEAENNEEGDSEEEKPADKVSASDKQGVVTAVFDSPTEKIFQMGQARNWSVEVDGLDQIGNEVDEGDHGEFNDVLAGLGGNEARTQCHFTFYINGTKYKERRNDDGCGFTSTFIDKTGSLQAQVEVEIYKEKAAYDDDMNYLGQEKEVLDTINLTRNYRVTESGME